MLNFTISTESACDLTDEQINNYQIKIAPVSFMIDEKEYFDGDENMPPKRICELMREGKGTKTFQINEYMAREHLQKLLKEGKDVLHISFTSTMSGTYNNFVKVASELNKTNKNKIYVLDSLCQSAGVGVLIMNLLDEAKSQNFTIQEAFDFAQKLRNNVAHIFTVDNLKYLARGGRISQTTALIANMISIKPIMYMDKEGKISTTAKAMGRKKALSNVVEKVREQYNCKYNKILIRHGDCEKEALVVAEKIRSHFSDVEIDLGQFGSTIVCHCGPGTIAVFFTADEKKA